MLIDVHPRYANKFLEARWLIGAIDTPRNFKFSSLLRELTLGAAVKMFGLVIHAKPTSKKTMKRA
jgi:hypothetical protein